MTDILMTVRMWDKNTLSKAGFAHFYMQGTGIRSSRHQGVSPPRDHLATKQSLLATNNLTTVNHKPKRLIRCLCYVERCVAITNQATWYNSLVLSHNDSNNALSISTMLKFCLINDSNHQQFVVHFNDAKVLSHKRLEQFLQCLKSTATT